MKKLIAEYEARLAELDAALARVETLERRLSEIEYGNLHDIHDYVADWQA